MLEFKRQRTDWALENLLRFLFHHLMTAKIRLPAEFIAQFEEGSGHE